MRLAEQFARSGYRNPWSQSHLDRWKRYKSECALSTVFARNENERLRYAKLLGEIAMSRENFT
jgi:hypothetical protein